MDKHLVATWSERGVVHIWDTSKHVILLDAPKAGGGASRNKLTGHKESPLFTFPGHKVSTRGKGSLGLAISGLPLQSRNRKQKEQFVFSCTCL